MTELKLNNIDMNKFYKKLLSSPDIKEYLDEKTLALCKEFFENIVFEFTATLKPGVSPEFEKKFTESINQLLETINN
jgi:hypothetical protein